LTSVQFGPSPDKRDRDTKIAPLMQLVLSSAILLDRRTARDASRLRKRKNWQWLAAGQRYFGSGRATRPGLMLFVQWS